MGLCGENADAVNRLDLQCVSIAVNRAILPARDTSKSAKYKIGDRRPVATLVPFRLTPAWFSGFVSNNNNSRSFSSDPGLVFRVPDLLLKLISQGSRCLNHYPPVRKTLCRVTTRGSELGFYSKLGAILPS